MIAKLVNLASGDTLSFILRGIDPAAEVALVYREMVAAEDGIFSHKNCVVAESGDRIVGMANAFPAGLIESEIANVVMTEREELLRPRTELNDPGSYLLNDIAVLPSYRRLGVGAALLTAVIDEAMRQSFRSVTLHVWADNTEAIAFYRAAGFKEVRHAEIPWHPDLPHTGGSLLMMLPVGVEKDESLSRRLVTVSQDSADERASTSA
jgi:ribosomal protein S18 acetylase RimI-like enzyme